MSRALVVTVCPPGPVPRAIAGTARLNRYGVSRPDNRAAEEPAPNLNRTRPHRRPSTLDMAALEAKARRAMARQSAEMAEKGTRDDGSVLRLEGDK